MATDTLHGRRVLSDIELEQLLARQPLDRSVFRRLWPLLAPVRWAMAGAALLELGVVASNFARPLLVQQALDRGWVKGADGALQVAWPLVSVLVAGLLLAWALRFGLAGLGQYLASRSAVRVLNALRVQVFSHVQSLGVGYFDRAKAGRIIARIDRDVDTLEPLIVQGPPEALSMTLRCLGAGAMLWWISPRLFLALALLVPPLVLASVWFKRAAQRNHARVAENRARFTAHLVETVAGVRVLQQMRQEENNQRHYQGLLAAFAQSLIHNHVTTGWFAPFAGALTTLGVVVLLGVGAHELALGRISLGDLAASLFCVQLFLGPLQELSDLFEKYSNGAASAQRVFLLLDTRPDLADDPTPVTLQGVLGEVRFEDVHFRYEPSSATPVLDGLCLALQAGERVAVIGRTGHGKSTLVQLLTRFYDPQRGQVTLDGVDLRRLSTAALRQHIGVVLQDSVLFSGSVLDNLRQGQPGADDFSLKAAAEALGVRELIERLPQGFDTQVGPLGSHLSQGQRQVVCLVRTFLADPVVLILDEATSAVDVQTERKVQRALGRLCKGRTVLLIAHRLSTVRDADRIAVIERGRVVEEGTHAGLLQRGGRYAAMWSALKGQAEAGTGSVDEAWATP
jgi:ATP-binding cassette subfamily B protein